MVTIVTAAFFGAAIARIRTDAAQLSMQVRPPAHKVGTDSAQVSAVTAEGDALRHHLHHLTAQASRRAVLAVYETVQTVLNAGLHVTRTSLCCNHDFLLVNLLGLAMVFALKQ